MPQNIIECVSSFFQVALFLSSALMIELETIELIREYIYETVDETFCNFTNFERSLFIWVLFSRIFETIFGPWDRQKSIRDEKPRGVDPRREPGTDSESISIVVAGAAGFWPGS